MTYLCALTVVVCVWTGGVHGGEDWCEVKGVRLFKGDTWQEEGQCVEVTCQGNNVSTALGCPSIRVDAASGWTLSEEDPTKSYPDCCPQPIPPSNTNTNTPQPPQCVEEGVIYQVGQHKDIPGWCGANICSGNNEWTMSACGLVATPEGWITIEEDPSKPYPGCCAKAVPSVEYSSEECLPTLEPTGNRNNPFTEPQDSFDVPTGALNYLKKEANTIPTITPELSNLELSGLPAEEVGQVDLQAPVLREDLTTIAQEDSEYWIQADDSMVQSVRSTFPNDRAGLKRMVLSKGVPGTARINNIGATTDIGVPKVDSVPEEGTGLVQIASKEVASSGENVESKISNLDESVIKTTEVGSSSDYNNLDESTRKESISEESSSDESKSSAEDSSKADGESKQDDFLDVPTKEGDADDSKEGALWFGIFK